MAETPVDNKTRRSVAGALIEFDDEKGVPLYAISSFSGLSKSVVIETLSLLELNEEVERVLPLKIDAWRITDYGRKAYRDERFASKLRKCLNCSQQFESSHAGNRMCEKCIASEYSSSEKSDAT